MFEPHTIFCHKGVGVDRKRGAEGVDQKVRTSYRSDRKVGKGQASGVDRQVCVCVCGRGGTITLTVVYITIKWC